MFSEEEENSMHALDTPNEVVSSGEVEMELEDYSISYILPRAALVLLMTIAVVGAPFILWRIWLSFNMLQYAGLGGFFTVLFVLTVFTTFWYLRKKSPRNIMEQAESAWRENQTVVRQTRFSRGVKEGVRHLFRWLGKSWEAFCGSKSPAENETGEGKVSFKSGIKYVLLWLREKREAFGRLTSIEKEACAYFMLAAIPEVCLLLFGTVHLQWSPLIKEMILLTVLPGLVFGLAGLVTGLVFWKKTGILKTPFLVLVAVYLNFAYESGGAILVR